MPGTEEASPRHAGRPPCEELVDLVDHTNRVVGLAARSQVRARNLLHRGVGILCADSKSRVWVHRRTETKDLFPGLYDMFVGGVVASGETYLASASREVEEELGIPAATPEFMFTHLYEGERNRAWIQVYRVTWDGPVTFQEEEIAWGGQVDASALVAWAHDHPIVPDGLDVFHHYLAWNEAGGPSSPARP